MAQYFNLHPDNPQPRLLAQAAALLNQGGVLAVPTDSGYALACHLDDKDAAERLRQVRQLDAHHPLSLLCHDLRELANYARVDNAQFRLLKAGTPGPFTFVLPASRQVPKRVSHPRRKTIGLRVPAHTTLQALLAEHGAPLLAATLVMPGEDAPLTDALDIRERLEKQIAAVIDAGACPAQPSTVIDLSGDVPTVLRHGLGDAASLGL
ncbi:MAG: threonylcarbamoyl-AMP synthase [Ottowia sp.]|nr:threonylcarbamoyl-AMP synthase [Ottowia sp.]